MGLLFGSKAPAPPPPPPAPPSLGTTSIMEAGAQERQRLASAEGQGFSGTDVTGGQGAKAPNTTANPPKTVLGG